MTGETQFYCVKRMQIGFQVTLFKSHLTFFPDEVGHIARAFTNKIPLSRPVGLQNKILSKVLELVGDGIVASSTNCNERSGIMPRKKRSFQPNSFYHCILRGNNRHNVFPTDEDMHELLRAFEMAYDRHPFQVIAFCFMSNHYHVLLRSYEGNLSQIMKIVNRRYSDSYHDRYGFIGRIYQGRFWANEVPTVRGLLEVSAYIHRNPIETEVPMVDVLEHYPYSSFPYYAAPELVLPRFLDVSYLPNLLPYPFPPTAPGYVDFVLHRSFFAIEDGRKQGEDMTQPLVPFKGLLLRERGKLGMRVQRPKEGQSAKDCPPRE